MGDYSNKGYVSSDFGSVTPMASTVDADAVSICEQSESQQEKDKLYVSVFFSILKKKDIQENNENKGYIDVKNTGYSSFNHCQIVWSEGDAYSNNDQYPQIFICCDDLLYDVLDGKVVNTEKQIVKINEAFNELDDFLYNQFDESHIYDVHINIGGFEILTDLILSMAYICNKKFKKDIKNKKLLTKIKTRYKGCFDNYKNIGWSIKVDFACAFSAYEAYIENETRIQLNKRRAQAERDREILLNNNKNIFLFDPDEARAANWAVTAATLDPETAKNLSHFALGLLSVFMPLLSIADAAMYIWEGILAESKGDKEGAKSAAKNAALDVILILPVFKLFKIGKDMVRLNRAGKLIREADDLERMGNNIIKESEKSTKMALQWEEEAIKTGDNVLGNTYKEQSLVRHAEAQEKMREGLQKTGTAQEIRAEAERLIQISDINANFAKIAESLYTPGLVGDQILKTSYVISHPVMSIRNFRSQTVPLFTSGDAVKTLTERMNDAIKNDPDFALTMLNNIEDVGGTLYTNYENVNALKGGPEFIPITPDLAYRAFTEYYEKEQPRRKGRRPHN